MRQREQMQPTITKPKKTTDIFRALKMGEKIQIETTHQEAPHSTARLVGIKVSTRIVEKIEGGGFVVEVTRIKAKKAK